MAKATATEVATSGNAELEARKAALQEVIAATISDMKADEFDAEQMMLDIFEAQSIDEVLGSEVVHMKDIIGVPMTIESAQLQESKFEEGVIPAYAVLRVKFDDGRRAVVTCGAAQVITALIAAHNKGWFPFRCSTIMVTSSKGNDVIRLVKAPPEQF